MDLFGMLLKANSACGSNVVDLKDRDLLLCCSSESTEEEKTTLESTRKIKVEQGGRPKVQYLDSNKK